MKSMTGFGKSELSLDGRSISVEIKSVNNRFLDLNIKLPKALSKFEEGIRKLLQKSISRGRVDVYINFDDASEQSKVIVFDCAIAKQLVDISRNIEKDFNIVNDFTTSRLMRTPDVINIQTNNIDDDIIKNMLFEVFENAIKSYDEMRCNEGEILKRDISKRIDSIKLQVDNLKIICPMTIKYYKEKLAERIKEILCNIDYDESKLMNEVAFFTDKCNIDEEITRLNSHIKQLNTIIPSFEPSGRRLDFLIQEMNREVNTICSKANNSEITKIGIDLKCEIEKIREQVQNIE